MKNTYLFSDSSPFVIELKDDGDDFKSILIHHKGNRDSFVTKSRKDSFIMSCVCYYKSPNGVSKKELKLINGITLLDDANNGTIYGNTLLIDITDNEKPLFDEFIRHYFKKEIKFLNRHMRYHINEIRDIRHDLKIHRAKKTMLNAHLKGDN